MEERQQKMRVRAKELKEKREKERKAIVEDKLDQQWRFIYHIKYKAVFKYIYSSRTKFSWRIAGKLRNS